MLAEVATKDIANATNPYGLEENKKVAKRGGNIAGNARKEIEKEIGQSVITAKNAIDLGKLITDISKPSKPKESNNKKLINSDFNNKK